MADNPRRFEATDPFGRKWFVSLRWLQNAISIRHCDAVDVKWEMQADDGTVMEKVIALPHASLVSVSAKLGRELTDPWCIRIAGNHLRRIVETWEDAEKIIVTPAAEQIEAHARLM
ncbi:MAG: hypothetical protein HYZ37_05975 [Candidatus Solibacter usitatus]|nr:hypothetical protein [Candidatus Solibacter usitatus]